MRQTPIGLVLLGTLTLGGCIFAPDSDGWDRRGQVEPTVGQELLDLDRAHQAGVITTTEYERTKDRILNGR